MEMQIQGMIKDGQVIVAPSFGAREIRYSDNSEYSNLNIAYQVQDICSERDIPVILQKEVAEAAKEWMFGNGKMVIAVIKKHRIEGKYLDTYEVLAQALEVIKKNGWSKVILISHLGQVWRAAKVLEKMGLEVIIPPGLEDIPFDPLSTQWWTRGPLFWWPWELVARIFYILEGYI